MSQTWLRGHATARQSIAGAQVFAVGVQTSFMPQTRPPVPPGRELPGLPPALEGRLLAAWFVRCNQRFTWGKGRSIAVPAGTYRVKVTLPGSRKAVIGPVTTSLAAGKAYQAYAVGSPGHYRLITLKIPVGIG